MFSSLWASFRHNRTVLLPVEGFSAEQLTFDTAARAVLRFLHQRLGLDLWMITRSRGEDWIVLQVEDSNYGIGANSVFRWGDSGSVRMIAGFGPGIATPDASVIPASIEIPVGHHMQIGSYIGVPLTYSDGSLFGTLCAIHPTPRTDEIVHELPLLELLAGMLSALLNSELNATEAARRAERAQEEAESDVLTGLYNRRAWDRFLALEDARCRRYGHPACVVAIDLDGLKAMNDSQGHAAGDRLIRRAAQAIRGAARESDIVARVGGDEFAVLGVECDPAMSNRLVQRMRAALEEAGVAASVGLAAHVPSAELQQAWHQADREMYRAKAAGRS